MADSDTTRRPWLAAVLSAAVTGLGHLYLRRWLRAVGWLGVVAATSLFVPERALLAAAAGEGVDVVALAPALLVATLCALDAYVLARAERRRVAVREDGELTRCPNCGGELDPDIEFCHWCTTEFGDLQVARPGEEGR